jgi:hypothetical protein
MCKPTTEEQEQGTHPQEQPDPYADTDADTSEEKVADTDTPEGKAVERYPWWRGSGIKPHKGADFGIFESSLEDRADCLSLWSLSYLNPLLSLGSRKVLDANDVGVPSEQDRAENAYGGTMAVWDSQYVVTQEANAKLKEEHTAALEACATDEARAALQGPVWQVPSISRSLIVSFGRGKIALALSFYIISALLSFVPVIILNDLVRYFEHVNNDVDGNYDWIVHPWFQVAGLGIVPVIMSGLQTRNQSIMAHCGVYVRTAVSAMLYNKSLKVSSAGRAKTSTGQVVNMMSNDTMQLQRFLQFVGMTMVAPIQIVVALFLIYQQVRR